jgi:fragile X mental retardation protein
LVIFTGNSKSSQSKKPSPWFMGPRKRSNSDGKDDKHDGRNGYGRGHPPRSDNRQGSQGKTQVRHPQPMGRPRGNSGGTQHQLRPSSGSLGQNWRKPDNNTLDVSSKQEAKKNGETVEDKATGEEECQNQIPPGKSGHENGDTTSESTKTAEEEKNKEDKKDIDKSINSCAEQTACTDDKKETKSVNPTDTKANDDAEVKK